MKLAFGALLVAIHVAAFLWLVRHAANDELAVTLRAAQSIDGTATSERVRVSTETTPGLQRRRWAVTYRGGFTREVAATALVGPFQDPAAPPCSGRVIVGQRLLDDMVPVMKQVIDRQLRGLDIFPVGAYLRIASLSFEWARVESSPGDRKLVGTAAPDGYVRARAEVVFERGSVTMLVALIPERAHGTLRFRIAAVADLHFNNAVLHWMSDKLGASSIATRVARDEIDDILVTTFAPPPPFELPDHQTLQFTYCDAPIEIAAGRYGALPFAVVIGAGAILPPHIASSDRIAPPTDTTLALDLDVDALNGLLYELWRTGWLDRQLAAAGLDRRFNSDPTVAEYLSLRISPPRLALPPVIAPWGGQLRLAADARVSLTGDGTHATTGRLWGALDFRFLRRAGTTLPVSVDLGALELSCERTPTTLVPCYGDLVAALRDRGDQFHGALTDAFAKLLADIFVERHLATPGVPAEVVIHGVAPSITPTGTLHLQLDGTLEPTP